MNFGDWLHEYAPVIVLLMNTEIQSLIQASVLSLHTDLGISSKTPWGVAAQAELGTVEPPPPVTPLAPEPELPVQPVTTPAPPPPPGDTGRNVP